MKTFISNHKNQSSFITLFVFTPLFFVFLYSKDFLHIQPNEIICRRKNKISIWKNKTSIKVEILFFYKP